MPDELPPAALMKELLVHVNKLQPQRSDHNRVLDLVIAFGCGWGRTCTANALPWSGRWPSAEVSLHLPVLDSVSKLFERLATHWGIFDTLSFPPGLREQNDLAKELVDTILREYGPNVLRVPDSASLKLAIHTTGDPEVPTRLALDLEPNARGLANRRAFERGRAKFLKLVAELSPAETGARTIWRMRWQGDLTIDTVPLPALPSKEADVRISIGANTSELRIDTAAPGTAPERVMLPGRQNTWKTARKMSASPPGDTPPYRSSIVIGAHRLELQERECSCGTETCRRWHTLAGYDPNASESLEEYVAGALWPAGVDSAFTVKNLQGTLFGAYLARNGISLERRPQSKLRFLTVERECLICPCGARHFGPVESPAACDCGRAIYFPTDVDAASRREPDNKRPRLFDQPRRYFVRSYEESMLPIGENLFKIEQLWACAGCTALKAAVGGCEHVLEGHDRAVDHVVLAVDDSTAVSTSADNTLRVWSCTAGTFLRALSGHSGAVTCAALHRGGELIVSASADHTLCVWTLGDGRCRWELEGHSARVNHVALSPRGSRAVSASSDGTLRVWSLTSGRCEGVLRGHEDMVRHVVLTRDAKRAVSASADGTLRVWSLESLECLHTLELKSRAAEVVHVALTSDDSRAVSAHGDGTLHTWSLKGGHHQQVLVGHSARVNHVVLTSDDTRAVTASDDKTVRVWSLGTGRCYYELKGHSDAVVHVVLDEGSQRAFSASWDGSVRVWSIDDGKFEGALKGHEDRVHWIALSRNGRTAVSVSADKTLRVWTLVGDRPAGHVDVHAASRVHFFVDGEGVYCPRCETKTKHSQRQSRVYVDRSYRYIPARIDADFGYQREESEESEESGELHDAGHAD